MSSRAQKSLYDRMPLTGHSPRTGHPPSRWATVSISPHPHRPSVRHPCALSHEPVGTVPAISCRVKALARPSNFLVCTRSRMSCRHQLCSVLSPNCSLLLERRPNSLTNTSSCHPSQAFRTTSLGEVKFNRMTSPVATTLIALPPPCMAQPNCLKATVIAQRGPLIISVLLSSAA